MMRCPGFPGLLLLLVVVFGAFVAGCGGGGETPVQSLAATPAPLGPVSVLGWDPPGTYSDNAAMDPYRDLDHYEVYVRLDGNFSDSDAPIAVIAAVTDAPGSGGNPGGKILEREFILENIQPFIPPGNRHYISMKAVGIDGQRSSFMPPIAWDTI